MSTPSVRRGAAPTLDGLLGALRSCQRLTVLTGAGCSTASGIPDYRDRAGEWKRRAPIHLPEFLASKAVRQRYWARSMVGWPAFAAARPNSVHTDLAALQRTAVVSAVVTQNVDGLHQRAGTREVIDLHGRLDQVLCLDCGSRSARDAVQARLHALNPHWQHLASRIAPDGDADLTGADYPGFRVPACHACGGLLKPDVVFFGENVPRARVQQAMDAVLAADALLVLGSSLMVFSGYRFVRAAAAAGRPVYIVNLGRTRGDPLATLKVDLPAQRVLGALRTRLLGRP